MKTIKATTQKQLIEQLKRQRTAMYDRIDELERKLKKSRRQGLTVEVRDQDGNFLTNLPGLMSVENANQVKNNLYGFIVRKWKKKVRFNIKKSEA